MASSEIVVNASGVNNDSLDWLMKDEKGYFITQQRNKSDSLPHHHRVSTKFAEKVIGAAEIDMQKAWSMMEEHVAQVI